MSLPEDDDRHSIYLAKLAQGLLNAHVYPSLEAAYRAARAILLDAESIETQGQMIRVMNSAGRAFEVELSKGYAGLTEGLEELADYEASYAATLFGKYAGEELSSPGKRKVVSFIDQSIMSLTSGKRVQSGTWAEFVSGAVESGKGQVNGIVVSGYQQGSTVSQMSQQIRAASNGVLKQEADTLARTGLSHYANQAREAMAQNNAAIKYRVFQATFDNRTTLICRSNHGKYWPIDSEDYPRLPLHYGERSLYIYVKDLKDADRGTQAAVGGKEVEDINPKRKLKYRGKRDTDIFSPGQIPAATDQTEWLRSQPDWFVDSAIGEKRRKLLKEGGMKIDRFVDMTGKPINLDKLRELDAEAFKRAGL